MSARVAPAKPPFPPEVDAVIRRTMPPGMEPFVLFTTVARDPRLFERFVARGFLGKGHLTVRQREIIIGRVTAQCGSEYEWGLHVAIFREKAGFTDAHVYSLVHGNAEDPCWTAEDERVLIRLCDSLHKNCDVDDALWKSLKAFYSDEAIIEMLLLAGNYRQVAYVTNVLRLPLEDSGTRFPSL